MTTSAKTTGTPYWLSGAGYVGQARKVSPAATSTISTDQPSTSSSTRSASAAALVTRSTTEFPSRRARSSTLSSGRGVGLLPDSIRAE